MERKTITVGLDFRPIPMDLGDGNVWEFDPDPSPSVFNELITSLKALAAVGKNISAEDQLEDQSFPTALERVKKAVGAILVDAGQQKKWDKMPYGFSALDALAGALVTELSGFTRKSSKDSGKG